MLITKNVQSIQVIIAFTLQFFIIYIVLMIPWPGWSDMYANWFRAGATILLSELGKDAFIYFEPRPPSGDGTADTNLRLYNRQLVGIGPNGETLSGKAFTSSRYPGYMSVAFLTSLIGATPIGWRRKISAWVIGFLLMHAYIYVAVLFLILNYYYTHPATGVISPIILGRPILRLGLCRDQEFYNRFGNGRFYLAVGMFSSEGLDTIQTDFGTKDLSKFADSENYTFGRNGRFPLNL